MDRLFCSNANLFPLLAVETAKAFEKVFQWKYFHACHWFVLKISMKLDTETLAVALKGELRYFKYEPNGYIFGCFNLILELQQIV